MSSAERLMPMQLRATQKRAALLDAAAEVITEKGYEAATLTDVAARAHASIGSLYRYFPDKPAVARALADIYGREIAELWGTLVVETDALDLAGLVDAMLTMVVAYLGRRPAFMVLLSAARDYQHTSIDRATLRGHIAALLHRRQPEIGHEEVLLSAGVVVEIIKGLSTMLERHAPETKDRIVQEFRLLLIQYLTVRLNLVNGLVRNS